MKLEARGDRCWVASGGATITLQVACHREASFIALGIEDLVPCRDELAVYFSTPTPEDVARLVIEGLANEHLPERPRPRIDIPICYAMGPDLNRVALALDISTDEVIRAHSSTHYSCIAIGFCPGFAYCEVLPPALQGVPRLATPRLTTPAGSLGITGNQTAVYPLPLPGGWPIIGMTPLVLVDVDDGFYPIQYGDRIQFHPISEAEFSMMKGHRLGAHR